MTSPGATADGLEELDEDYFVETAPAQIFLNYRMQHFFCVEVQEHDFILDVKAKINYKMGLCPAQQMLVLTGGLHFGDDWTLAQTKEYYDCRAHYPWIRPRVQDEYVDNPSRGRLMNAGIQCINLIGRVMSQETRDRQNDLNNLRDKYGFWIADLGSLGEAHAKAFKSLQQMLSDGVDPDTLGIYDETALLRTQGVGLKVPLLLLRHGANPNFRCETVLRCSRPPSQPIVAEAWDKIWGGSLLHMSAAGGNLPLVKLLLAAGADLQALNSDQKTPEDVGSAACKAYIKSFRAGKMPVIDFRSGTLKETLQVFSESQTLVVMMQAGKDMTTDQPMVRLTNLASEDLTTYRFTPMGEYDFNSKFTSRRVKAAIAEQLLFPVGDLRIVLQDGSMFEDQTPKEVFGKLQLSQKASAGAAILATALNEGTSPKKGREQLVELIDVYLCRLRNKPPDTKTLKEKAAPSIVSAVRNKLSGAPADFKMQCKAIFEEKNVLPNYEASYDSLIDALIQIRTLVAGL